jgi:hypothetical protein
MPARSPRRTVGALLLALTLLAVGFPTAVAAPPGGAARASR